MNIYSSYLRSLMYCAKCCYCNSRLSTGQVQSKSFQKVKYVNANKPREDRSGQVKVKLAMVKVQSVDEYFDE